MPLPVNIQKRIRDRSDELVEQAKTLSEALGTGGDYARQLRLAQETLLATGSLGALDVFLQYQAVRKLLPVDWPQRAADAIAELSGWAAEITKDNRAEQPATHRELAARLLGYAVRWRTIHEKGRADPAPRGGR